MALFKIVGVVTSLIKIPKSWPNIWPKIIMSLYVSYVIDWTIHCILYYLIPQAVTANEN